VERNRHYLNRWIEALGGDLDIHLIDNPRLVAGRQRLNGQLSPGTINLTFAVLRSCFNWAIDRDGTGGDARRQALSAHAGVATSHSTPHTRSTSADSSRLSIIRPQPSSMVEMTATRWSQT
jgi:hypothetical protein